MHTGNFVEDIKRLVAVLEVVARVRRPHGVGARPPGEPPVGGQARQARGGVDPVHVGPHRPAPALLPRPRPGLGHRQGEPRPRPRHAPGLRHGHEVAPGVEGVAVPAEAAVLHRGVAEHGVEGAEAAGQVAASELLGREDGPARHPATTQHTHGYIRSL